jgi:hypothetical protein
MAALALGIGAIGAGCDDNENTDTDDTDTTDTDVPCPTTGTGGPRITCIVDLEGDTTAGSTFYDLNCQTCHADDGTGGQGPSYPPPADLTASMLDEPNVVAIVLAGSEGTDMDSYAPYQNQDLANVTTYVFETFISP